MAPSTDRQTFRALVADVAARAKEKLPEAVNGRIESAVKLVLAHDVHFLDDGTVEVGSSSDPLKTYLLAGPACACQDFSYGKAPEGWCSHRIAAGISKRVGELLAAQTAAAPQVHGDSHTPPTLPEAPASVNVRVTICGRECQITLRDTDESRLLARLQALLAQYPVPQAASQQAPLSPQQHNAAAMHRPVSGFCAVHNVEMKLNDKNGKQWWSHRLPDDQGWCKGK